MDKKETKINQLKNIVQIATAAEKTKRADEVMEYISDNGGLVRMQELYDNFETVSERAVRRTVSEIDNNVVVKYRTTNNIVEVKLKDKETTKWVLAARRANKDD